MDATFAFSEAFDDGYVGVNCIASLTHYRLRRESGPAKYMYVAFLSTSWYFVLSKSQTAIPVRDVTNHHCMNHDNVAEVRAGCFGDS